VDDLDARGSATAAFSSFEQGRQAGFIADEEDAASERLGRVARAGDYLLWRPVAAHAIDGYANVMIFQLI
jgi:hypothetical protein